MTGSTALGSPKLCGPVQMLQIEFVLDSFITKTQSLATPLPKVEERPRIKGRPLKSQHRGNLRLLDLVGRHWPGFLNEKQLAGGTGGQGAWFWRDLGLVSSLHSQAQFFFFPLEVQSGLPRVDTTQLHLCVLASAGSSEK